MSILDYPMPALDEKVFQDGKLKKNHVTQILRKLDRELAAAGLKDRSWIKDVILMGSLTSLQWHPRTDADIHVIVDEKLFQELEGKEMEFLDALRKKINESDTKLEGTQHPVEFYFEGGQYSSQKKDGVYSLLQEEWLKEPSKVSLEFDIEKDYPELIRSAQEAASEIDVDLGEIQRNVNDVNLLDEALESLSVEDKGRFLRKMKEKLESIEQEIEEIVSKAQVAKDRRHESYDPSGESEVVFKYLQRHGYLYIAKRLQQLLEEGGGIKLEEMPEVEEVAEVKPESVVAAFVREMKER